MKCPVAVLVGALVTTSYPRSELLVAHLICGVCPEQVLEFLIALVGVGKDAREVLVHEADQALVGLIAKPNVVVAEQVLMPSLLGKLAVGGGQALNDLVNYAQTFMNPAHYDRLRLAILYEGFRHKIAHLGHPYVVFDTATSSKVPKPQRRVTWTVCAGNRALPIELVPYSPPRKLQKTRTPWPVAYDHRVKISIHRLKVDAVSSIYGSSGYLARLETDRSARERFARCMIDYYPC